LPGFFTLNCAGTNPPVKATDQNVDYLIEQGKTLWEQRTDQGSLNKAEHFIHLAHQQRPEDFQLSVLLGNIKYTKAYFLETNPDTQDELFLQGSTICRDAVLGHPEFKPMYENARGDSAFRLVSSLANAPKSVVPGLFWWATNLVWYLNKKPVLERLNHRELLEVIMHRVLSLDPGFYYSGPYRFFGSLYTRIPGIELSQSETYFKQALSSNPEYLGNAVLMAEFYHQKAGNREQFHRVLEQVLNTNLTDHPELMTENFFYQGQARILLEKESSLFE